MADEYKDLSHTAAQIDSAIDLTVNHVANTSQHITETERTNWNAKVDSSALTTEAATRESADTALQTAINGKQDAEEGMGLSEESYTTTEKQKLAGLENYYTRNPSAAIAANSDLNEYSTPGRYGCNTGSVAATILNAPYSTSGYRLEVVETTGNNLLQKLYPNHLGLASGAYYMRTYAASNDTWTSWYKYQGEAVT